MCNTVSPWLLLQTQLPTLGFGLDLWHCSWTCYHQTTPVITAIIRRLFRSVYIIFFVHGWFLPHDAMLAQYMLSSCVCLSVRRSVTSQHCTKTTKHSITPTTQYDSTGTPIFWCLKPRRNSSGVTFCGSAK